MAHSFRLDPDGTILVDIEGTPWSLVRLQDDGKIVRIESIASDLGFAVDRQGRIELSDDHVIPPTYSYRSVIDRIMEG